jgi:hypothetical protein
LKKIAVFAGVARGKPGGVAARAAVIQNGRAHHLNAEICGFARDSQVRHLRDAAEAAGRYGSFSKDLYIMTLTDPWFPTRKPFLSDPISKPPGGALNFHTKGLFV